MYTLKYYNNKKKFDISSGLYELSVKIIEYIILNIHVKLKKINIDMSFKMTYYTDENIINYDKNLNKNQ